MNPQDAAAEQRRWAILKCLEADADYRINDTLLHAMLQKMNLGVAMAVLLSDIAWLEQQRLVATEPLLSCTMVLLRGEGRDVAQGLSVVPGIARPRPV